MGSYAHCWLDELYISESKNGIDPDIISLFRSKDKIVTLSPTNFFLRRYKDFWSGELDESEFQVIFYEVPVYVIRDRLNVLGYNFENSKEAFLAWKTGEIEHQLESAKRFSSMQDKIDQEIETLSVLSPELWIQKIKAINDLKIKPNYYGQYEISDNDPIISYMLKKDWYGFPGYDFYAYLRMATEALEESKKFFYDVTDLVLSGYFEYEDDFIDYGIDIASSEFVSKSKIIVENINLSGKKVIFVPVG